MGVCVGDEEYAVKREFSGISQWKYIYCLQFSVK